jgi:ABC-type sulfate/molybdate transport systems ATPase subunit
MSSVIVHIEQLEVIKQETFTLNIPSFSLNSGTRLGIMGETGSGKTSFLKTIGGLEGWERGHIRVNGQNIIHPDQNLIPGHPGVCYLSQHFELRNHYRVEELVDFEPAVSQAKKKSILDWFGLNQLLTRKTQSLSGGEKQRVALVLQLLKKPSLLLLDEPFSQNDPQTRRSLLDWVMHQTTNQQMTCMLISHDPLEVMRFANRLMILQHGKVVADDSPQALFFNPADQYVAGLLGEYTCIAHPAALFNVTKHALPELILRPSQVHITEDQQSALVGRLESVHFLGDYYLFTVRIQDMLIKGMHPSGLPLPAIGTNVHIGIQHPAYSSYV